jgi:glycosyltransferase involved in cell wall biosynthesis
MEISTSEIGVGILTYNRPDYYKQVIKNIPRDKIGTLIVVNDGENGYVKPEPGIDEVVLNLTQKGVSKSKNIILKYLISKGCKHLFIIEDDILIKNKNVFEEYIKAASSTGIHHLCFEKIAGNEKNLKFTLEQPDGVKLGFYHNPQGAFMYVHANLISKLGFFDENYHNAFEHIDFAYNLINKQVMPPFWYFPDLLNSEAYLTDIEGSSENSSITDKGPYKENWQLSAKHFTTKWGHFTNTIKDIGVPGLINSLKFLQQNYSRKRTINKNHKLSIIVPYRDREKALKLLIPSLQEYIPKQVENFEIIVVEQSNDKPFNKGLLNNIGFKNSSGDYVCFHDVDLIPEFADYSYPEKPTHMSVHCSQFNYVNIPDKIMGGVILFKREHFIRVNGYSNLYEGWGKEDDDLYERCVRERLTPYKHHSGRYYSVPHVHRLSNPAEVSCHEKNGTKFRNFLSNKKDIHETEGLNSLPKTQIIHLDNDDGFRHIKVIF